MHQTLPIRAFNDNYIWMIVHPDHRAAVVVDPGDAKPVIAALKSNNLTLKAILITHHHWDHTGGVAELRQRFDVPVYGPAHDKVECDARLTEGEIVKLDSIEAAFSVLDIPGHTKGHIAFLGHNMLFCGDTLFAGGCGRLFEGTAEQMVHSLAKLSSLPPETKVYCAHEYTQKNLQFARLVEPENPDLLARIEAVQTLMKQGLPTLPSTIEIEQKTNPFLRCSLKTVRKSIEDHFGRKMDSALEVFAQMRRWKDGF